MSRWRGGSEPLALDIDVRTRSTAAFRVSARPRLIRRLLLGVWALALVSYCVFLGLPFDRASLILWALTGVMCASVGRRRARVAMVDFLPFGLVLVGYDYLRGVASTLGMPTHWQFGVDADKFLFFGHVPTLWLQGWLKYPTTQWWEIAASLVYVSYFVLFAAVAAALWLRSRRDFYRWTYRFIPLCLVAFTSFALLPAAPPWAAARCSPADLAGAPVDPRCMTQLPSRATNALLGPLPVHHAGAYPYVERMSGRGLHFLHIVKADNLLQNGQQISDAVAAVPSMHSAGVMLFVLFMWRRVRRGRTRVLLALYPLAMGFVLVYAGEHYVIDVLLGWLAAVLVNLVASGFERRWHRRRSGSAAQRCPPAVAAQRPRQRSAAGAVGPAV